MLVAVESTDADVLSPIGAGAAATMQGMADKKQISTIDFFICHLYAAEMLRRPRLSDTTQQQPQADDDFVQACWSVEI